VTIGRFQHLLARAIRSIILLELINRICRRSEWTNLSWQLFSRSS